MVFYYLNLDGYMKIKLIDSIKYTAK